MTRRVVVTGVGAVTAVGHNARETWAAMVEGRSGIDRITLFDPEPFPVRIQAEVRGYELGERVEPKQQRHMNRSVIFGVGAALFDRDGVLRRLGVRLVPSASAEASVDALGGTRHTSGRRYSYDEPHATVVVVSEDGPVTVLRHGRIVGRSPVT